MDHHLGTKKKKIHVKIALFCLLSVIFCFAFTTDQHIKPLGQQYINGTTHVHHLLDEHGSAWDLNKLEMMFTTNDVDDIKHIAIGGPSMRDYLAWNFSKNGQFTVKSAYHLCMSLKGVKTGQPGSSMPSREHKAWLALWDTNAPGKAKIHAWRLMKNGLL